MKHHKIRFSSIIEYDCLSGNTDKLLKECTFQKKIDISSDIENTPTIANCVTAVRWLLYKSFKIYLPHAYIGCLPKKIISTIPNSKFVYDNRILP